MAVKASTKMPERRSKSKSRSKESSKAKKNRRCDETQYEDSPVAAGMIKAGEKDKQCRMCSVAIVENAWQKY